MTATSTQHTGNPLLFKLLVDTGASCSIIDHDLYKNHFSHISLKPVNTRIKGVSGGVLMSVGKVLLPFKLDTVQCLHEFLVVPHSTQDAILGSDFLFGTDSNIHLGKMYMKLTNIKGDRVSVPLFSHNVIEKNRKVTVSEFITIPPRSQAIMPCEVSSAADKVQLDGVSGFLTRNNSLIENKGLVTAASLVRVVNNTVPVRVLNPLNTHVSLRKGQAVCYFEPEHEVSTVILDEDSVPNQNIVSDKKLPDGIDLSKTELDSEHEKQQLVDLLCEFSDIFANDLKQVGTVKGFKYHINTGDSAPVKKNPYRVNF